MSESKFAKNAYVRHSHGFICEKSNIETYLCNNCGFKTHFLVVLKNHLNNRCHSAGYNINKYKCNCCAFETNSLLKLLSHLKTKCINKNLKRFQCAHCTFASKCRHILNKHIDLRHVQKGRPELYFCTRCDCGFKTRYRHNLSRHVFHAHMKSKQDEYHKCPQCNFTSKYKSSLQVHICVSHTMDQEVTWFECLYCSYKSVNKRSLRNHLMYTHSVQKYLDNRKNEVDMSSRFKNKLKLNWLKLMGSA